MKRSAPPSMTSSQGFLRVTLKTLVVCGLFFSSPWMLDATGSATLEAIEPVVEVWEARYHGPDDGSDSALSIAASPDGSRVFVTGKSSGIETGLDYATLAYDSATGEELWVARHSGLYWFSDVAKAITAGSSDSTVFVTGYSWDLWTRTDISTLAYDSVTGEEVWSARYEGPYNDYPSSMGLSADGRTLFVTGTSWGSGTQADYLTLAYDTRTGEEIWSTREEGPGKDEAASLVASSDGSMVFVTGSSSTVATGPDCLTSAYDAATGEQVWSHRYAGPFRFSDGGTAVAASPDGSTVFVTGHAWAFDTGHHFLTIASDAASGDEVWTTRYANPSSDTDFPHAVAVSPDGSTVFVAGISRKGSSFEYATLAYSAETGEEIWNARLPGPFGHADDTPSLIISPDGSRVALAIEFCTAVYDSGTGEEIWGIENDYPSSGVHSLTMSPDGARMFTAGYEVVDGGLVYATRAFAFVLQATIDILPDDPFNRVSACARTPVTVAILGNEHLDVREIDMATLRFGPGDASVVHDPGNAFVRKQHLQDVNLDGYLDLLVHFSAESAGLIERLESATLTGKMEGGRPMAGEDSVLVHGCF